MMRSYNERVIKELDRSVTEDEYDDEYQDKNNDKTTVLVSSIYSTFLKRNMKSGNILEIGPGSYSKFDVGVTHFLEPNPVRYRRLKEREKDKVVVNAFAENIPFESDLFDTVFLFGTFTFLRSVKEFLFEVNRILKNRGVLIFDSIYRTNLSIALGYEPYTLCNFVSVFGFILIERRYFKDSVGQEKFLWCFEKIRDFDISYLRVPFVIGDIKNFVIERDWFLK